MASGIARRRTCVICPLPPTCVVSDADPAFTLSDGPNKLTWIYFCRCCHNNEMALDGFYEVLELKTEMVNDEMLFPVCPEQEVDAELETVRSLWNPEYGVPVPHISPNVAAFRAYCPTVLQIVFRNHTFVCVRRCDSVEVLDVEFGTIAKEKTWIDVGPPPHRSIIHLQTPTGISVLDD